ncbi:MAG TPA: hypothetical protein VFO60_12460 [Candidatus Dormibacteraeota bacterium]|nr:hypothetical protein [Candidatus Dormibacteraeota bacterium]
MLNFRRDMVASPRRRWEAPLAAAVFAVLAIALFGRVWVTRSAPVAGLGNDPALFIWYLRWTPWAIVHGQDPLITHLMLAPDGANLMWNTSVILPAFVLWPVTAVVGPEWSYDVLLTAAPALSAWVAFLALRRFASAPAAAAGALLYGFSPAVVGQSEGHPMISLAVYPPLAMLLLTDIVTSESRRRRLVCGGALGAATAAQILTGTELLAITVISACIALAVLAALHPSEARSRARSIAGALAVAAATGIVLGAFPLAVDLAGPQRVSGVLQPTDTYVEDAVGVVVPGPFQQIAPDAAQRVAADQTGNGVENSGYLGIPLIAAIGAIAVLLRRRRAVWWAIGTFALIMLLAIGPDLHVDGRIVHVPLPWRALEALPLLDNLLPVRLMIVAYLPLAFLCALGIDAAIAHRRRLRARAAAVALGALVALSLWPKPVLAEAPVVAPFFTSGGASRIPDGGLALVSPEWFDHSAMLDQALADMRFRLADGAAFIPGPHFGPAPTPLSHALFSAEKDATWSLPGQADLGAARSDLLARALDAVVVAPQPHEARVVELMTALLGSAPQEVDGVELWLLSPVTHAHVDPVPPGSLAYDHALVMTDDESRWSPPGRSPGRRPRA